MSKAIAKALAVLALDGENVVPLVKQIAPKPLPIKQSSKKRSFLLFPAVFFDQKIAAHNFRTKTPALTWNRISVLWLFWSFSYTWMHNMKINRKPKGVFSREGLYF